GLIIGLALALLWPKQLSGITILGELFVGALKAVAPVLVFFLVMGAISGHKKGQKTNMKSIIGLYLLGTFLAGLCAVIASYIFKVNLILAAGEQEVTPPGGIVEVLKGLLTNIVQNPVTALMEANYLGILFWAVLLGLALKIAAQGTKDFIGDMADAVSQVVRWVIKFAPLGVMGLVFTSVSKSGLGTLLTYGQLLLLLVGLMLFVAVVVNP
ncbi:MAG: cation:dicarboxylase symporter family transporter, partial [Anaerovoracaceae bacterium]